MLGDISGAVTWFHSASLSFRVIGDDNPMPVQMPSTMVSGSALRVILAGAADGVLLPAEISQDGVEAIVSGLGGGKTLADVIAAKAVSLTARLVWATGTDAAANPDAGAYTAAAACRMRLARCDTNSALVSLDDGVTWLHLALANYSGEQWYAVPAGSKVKAKNAVAGSNFAALSIEIGAV